MSIIQTVGGGPTSVPPQHTGPRGAKGWTPTFKVVADGEHRKVIQVDWQGGAAPKPAIGYIGANGVVATAAEATDVTALKITSMTQQPDYSLLVTFHDGSTYTVANFFADMVTKANDVATKYPDILAKHADILNKYAEIEQKRIEVNNGATNATASANAAANLVLGVATNRPSIRPILPMDFANARRLDPRITFTRNSSAWGWNQHGDWTEWKANEPRFVFDPVTGRSLGFLPEESSTNHLRNPIMTGATVGVIGSGGTWPTRWGAFTGGTGLIVEIVAVGKEKGMDYIDVRFYGSHSVGSYNIYLDGSNPSIVAATGQTWTGGLYSKLIAGSWSNIGDFSVSLEERLADGSYLTAAGVGIKSTVNTSDLKRINYTRTLSNASTGKLSLAIAGAFANNVPIDITIRIAAPQVEPKPFATSFIPCPAGVAYTRQADVAVIGGVNFAGLWNGNEISISAEYETGGQATDGAGLAKRVIGFSNGTASELLTITNTQVGITTGGVGQQTSAHSVAFTANIVARRAVSITKTRSASSWNGAAVTSNNVAITLPNVDRVHIGSLFGTQSFLNEPIRSIMIYGKPLLDTEVQASTSSALLAGRAANQLPTAGELPSAAFFPVRAILESRSRQEFSVEGTGAAKTITIRRPYDFRFELVETTGVTITAQPSASCLANTSYTLTFNAPAGTILTYSITPTFSL